MPDSLLDAYLPRSQTSLQPEKRLMVAVLEDAVETLRRHGAARDHRGHRLFLETSTWFASNDATEHFSFLNICHALDLEPSYLRAGLRRLRQAQPAAPHRPADPPAISWR